MICKRYALKWRRPLPLLLGQALAMTLAVSQTACSTLLEDVTGPNAALPPAVAAQANPAPLPAPKLPEIPPHLVKCVETAPKTPPTKDGKPATADQKVTALKLTADERRLCSKAILAWYKKLQAAETAGKAKKG
jgi:hypothetical protein